LSAFGSAGEELDLAAEDVLITDGEVFDGIEVALLAWSRGSAGDWSSRFDADWDFIWVGNLEISDSPLFVHSRRGSRTKHTRAADIVSSVSQQPNPRSTHAKEDSPLVWPIRYLPG
jgi:hypothetical protein